MTRGEKIAAFLRIDSLSLYWCTANVCACRGCINGSRRMEWERFSNGESPITYEEFVMNKPPEVKQDPISFSFKGYKI